MAKTINCPKCGQNGITINANQFYEPEFSEGISSGFPNRVVCEKCKKILRYKMVKKKQYIDNGDNING